MLRWIGGFLRNALSIVGVWPIVKLLMRRRYLQQRFLERLLFSYDQTGPVVYINQYREAVDNIILKIRNFWPFEISLSGMAMNVVLDTRDCGTVVPKNSVIKLPRQGGTAQVVFNALNLATKDVTYVRQLCQEKSISCLTVRLSGNVHIRTFFDDFEIGVQVSAYGMVSFV